MVRCAASSDQYGLNTIGYFVYTRLQKTEKWGCISLGVCYAQVVFGAADEAATYSLTDQKV